MTRVIARIVIDSDDWAQEFPTVEDHSVVFWKRIESTRAHPFSEHEVIAATGLLGDQYFD
jgi:hypothetical protein